MQEYLDHKLECPYCGTIRLRIPADATESTESNAMTVTTLWAPGASCRTILQSKAATTAFSGCREAGSNGPSEKRPSTSLSPSASFPMRVA